MRNVDDLADCVVVSMEAHRADFLERREELREYVPCLSVRGLVNLTGLSPDRARVGADRATADGRLRRSKKRGYLYVLVTDVDAGPSPLHVKAARGAARHG